VVALTVAQALAIIYSSRAVDVVFTDMELRTQADGGTLIDAVVEKQRPKLRCFTAADMAQTAGLSCRNPFCGLMAIICCELKFHVI
jgi:hypothetical protein